MKVQVDNIRRVSEAILVKSGVPAEHARIIADTIVYAHVRGKHTHGLGRMNIYLRKIGDGLMAADTPIEILRDEGAICHMDAHNGFGQVAAYYAMERAIGHAREYGIGLSCVKDSNNFGTAGYFTKMASDHRMIGLVFGNAAPAIAPAGGDKALFGTNPLSYAFPTADPDAPVVFDMATTVAARGKIRLAAEKGESIPGDWALDAEGKPTTDPNAALEGTMLPIGGYKGVGLSVLVDVLAGMLSGAGFAGDVKNLNHKTEISRSGHAMIAIDIARFMDWETYLARSAKLLEQAHACGGVLPGEGTYKKALIDGDCVDLPEVQIRKIGDIASALQLDCALV